MTHPVIERLEKLREQWRHDAHLDPELLEAQQQREDIRKREHAIGFEMIVDACGEELDDAITDIAAMLAEPQTAWHSAGMPPPNYTRVVVTDGVFFWRDTYLGEWHHGPARNYPTYWTADPPPRYRR